MVKGSGLSKREANALIDASGVVKGEGDVVVNGSGAWNSEGDAVVKGIGFSGNEGRGRWFEGLWSSVSRMFSGASLALWFVLFTVSLAQAQQPFIVVASTTSTEQSGLFKHLLPVFEKVAGVQVRVVALGTGQALDLARRGDADVAFVHDTELELKFVADGHAIEIGRAHV